MSMSRCQNIKPKFQITKCQNSKNVKMPKYQAKISNYKMSKFQKCQDAKISSQNVKISKCQITKCKKEKAMYTCTACIHSRVEVHACTFI
jgi:hypothetical protein